MCGAPVTVAADGAWRCEWGHQGVTLGTPSWDAAIPPWTIPYRDDGDELREQLEAADALITELVAENESLRANRAE